MYMLFYTFNTILFPKPFFGCHDRTKYKANDNNPYLHFLSIPPLCWLHVFSEHLHGFCTARNRPARRRAGFLGSRFFSPYLCSKLQSKASYFALWKSSWLTYVQLYKFNSSTLHQHFLKSLEDRIGLEIRLVENVGRRSDML